MCGVIGLAILLLIMTMIERRIAAWSAPQVEPAVADVQPSAVSLPTESRTVQEEGSCEPAAQWIIADDYPAEAIRREYEGTVRIEWTVGNNGRVSSCHILESSGHDLLDQAGCQAIMARGCYDPAKLPAKRTMSRRIVWRLPW